ncbi:hypothetical protein BGX28_004975 [Mortierella sp. GBA30]|nr:hypothetical protein BGX28_004975 [Mortierella sp. GBA30]
MNPGMMRSEILVQNPDFYRNVVDIANKKNLSLNIPATAALSNTHTSAKPGMVLPIAATKSKVSTTAQHQTRSKLELSKGQRKRRRKREKVKEKRVKSYVCRLTQSTVDSSATRKKTRRLAAAAASGPLALGLTPEHMMHCRKKLLNGCKSNSEFHAMATKEIAKLVADAEQAMKIAGSARDKQEGRRRLKAMKNLRGYHELIVKSVEADLQVSSKDNALTTSVSSSLQPKSS